MKISNREGKQKNRETNLYAQDFPTLGAENLAAILDSVADGVFATDATLRIIYCNAAAARITGFSREEALQKSCMEIFRQILDGEECLVHQAVEREEYVREAERVIACADGRRKTVLVTSTPLVAPTGYRQGVVIVFRDISELRRLEEELHGRYHFHALIGKSPSMQRLYRLLEQVADTPVTVLIEGETGTGKELVARTLHYSSARTHGPFVPVQCSALPDTLVESELFGYVRGAFTGALTNRIGRIEAAQGGTLFLDEIGELSLSVQVKLLRVLQERCLTRLGENQERSVDVRIIAATNRPLRELVCEGRFRQDLYYRLNVVPLILPPLRERKEDIPLLITHFLEKYRHSLAKTVRGLSSDAMAALFAYPWPGNVRELEHAIQHALVFTQGSYITAQDLPVDIRPTGLLALLQQEIDADPKCISARERTLIAQALQETGGNRTQAAKRLGISRTTLWRKLRAYGLANSP